MPVHLGGREVSAASEACAHEISAYSQRYVSFARSNAKNMPEYSPGVPACSWAADGSAVRLHRACADARQSSRSCIQTGCVTCHRNYGKVQVADYCSSSSRALRMSALALRPYFAARCICSKTVT